MEAQKSYKIIISGGGTGGHIYPAIAVADALKEKLPESQILFVGAEGKMEMEKVPKVGYEIKGLPIAGIQRRITYQNLLFPFKLWQSMRKAKQIVKEFNPDVAIGFGGYASGPVLKASANKNVTTVLQEQNSFAGLTNKWLSKSASLICVAYDGMEKYFPSSKIVLTGNPVRKDISTLKSTREEAASFFGLDASKKTVLVIGGSLGARTINESILAGLCQMSDYQLLWQTGKFYYQDILSKIDKKTNNVKVHEFIYEMDKAYALADVVVSRAGALSISELCIVGKPVILVPSPNVAEDHQTKNAMSLVKKDAALLVSDHHAKGDLPATIKGLLNDSQLCERLSTNIKNLGKPNAADEIANEIIKLLK